ncbi:thiol:disulfide interchange protein [Erythrobacter sp. QSSC1-22B]|nr:protein-disulfide reductase DsbD [Erythrobacter sp. QSSC1-22B]OBX20793.1 thiol:disulfide interchange protein [Erythrobacter sp. QSSC1-22B]
MLNGLRSLLALLACALLFASATHAQAPRENSIRAELFADGPAVAGEEWTLALHFTPVAEEWHGYWRNPGDAGYGMELDWQLPEGWEAGEPLYPVPERLVISGLMNHIYEGPYTVLVPVRVPAGARTGDLPAIAVEADYLACTDIICVPQQARLTLDPSNIARDPRFDRWRAAIAPLLDTEGRFAIWNELLRVAIPVPAALDLRAPHVFIGEPDLVDYTARQAFFRDGDRLIAEIPLDRGQVPDSLSGILSFGSGEGVRFTARPGGVPPAGTPLAQPADALPSVWLALLGALLGGLLLNIMPCVFPILSLKALSLAKAGGDKKAARRDAVFYTLGVVLACLALGAVLLALRAAGEQIGWAFQLQEPAVVVALLVLAAAITANFAGAFELPGLVMRGGKGGSSSFATGLLAAFVATPCTGPFMAAAMGAALLLPVAQALALFAALGVGLALPFLLLGFVPALRRALPRPGPWMVTFRCWMALPMALTALALVWLLWRMAGTGFALMALGLAAGTVLLLAVLFARRAGRFRVAGVLVALATIAGFAASLPGQQASPVQASDSIHAPRTFSEAALAEARASGQPVFVWFTADWCVTCKVNERAAIERDSVRAAFEDAGVITLVGDWTRRDEEIAGFLTDQGAAGVPLYLWYPPQGEAQALPQVLTPDLLAELARQAR